MRSEVIVSRYSSYTMGMCPTNNVQECARRNPEECRNCRQENSQEESGANEARVQEKT